MAKRSRGRESSKQPLPPAPGADADGAPARRSWARLVPAGALLLVGVACWLGPGGGKTNGVGPVVAAAVAGAAGLAVALLPQTGGAVGRAVGRMREPSRKGRAVTAAVLGLVSAYYLLETATGAGRSFRPVLHDEHCYMIQTQMAARGRLWMPPHPLGEHFESFHLITDRVYAAKYGPGTALLCAPAVWLALPPGMVCLALTAGSVALLYLVLCRTVDGLAGLIGAAMLPAVPEVRRVSIEVTSQAPMAFLTLLAVWAFLHWRRGRGRGWLAVAWGAVGWCVMTRPVDGASLALAVGLGVLVTWWQARRAAAAGGAAAAGRSRVPRWVWEAAIVAGALAPFAGLQLACNRGITGRWLELPWAYYGARHDPYDTLSVAASPPGAPHRPVSAVSRMRAFPEMVSEPAYRAKVAMSPVRRVVDRTLTPALRLGLPNPLLLVLAPVAVLGLWSRGRWVLVATVPGFLLVYSRYTYVLAHYVTAVTPALILAVLVGWDVLAGLWGRRGATAVRAAGGAAVAALSLAALPQLRADPPADEWDFAPILRLVDERVAQAARAGPAVVLFRAEPGAVNVHIEPTYNVDVAWPDDAPVVRAHDLGPDRNRRLFAYYADRARSRGEPERAVFLYDLSPATLAQPPRYLGTVRELAGAG